MLVLLTNLFYSAFSLLFISIIVAFVAATPVGPVNLWVTQASLSKSSRKIKWFVIGVILADLIYVSIAFGSHFFLFNRQIQTIEKSWGFIGALAITIMGVFMLLKSRKKDLQIRETSMQLLGKIKYLLTGLILCASNVMVLLFWFFMAGVYQSYGLSVNSLVEFLAILLGLAIGEPLWFAFFAYLLKKGAKRFQLKAQKLMILRVLIAFVLIGFGLYTFYKYLR